MQRKYFFRYGDSECLKEYFLNFSKRSNETHKELLIVPIWTMGFILSYYEWNGKLDSFSAMHQQAPRLPYNY
jgi:hypothetical protein